MTVVHTSITPYITACSLLLVLSIETCINLGVIFPRNPFTIIMAITIFKAADVIRSISPDILAKALKLIFSILAIIFIPIGKLLNSKSYLQAFFKASLIKITLTFRISPALNLIVLPLSLIVVIL